MHVLLWVLIGWVGASLVITPAIARMLHVGGGRSQPEPQLAPAPMRHRSHRAA